jgi:phospholipid/cholesterol/gamma-HCH transport system ATP-binding protein
MTADEPLSHGPSDRKRLSSTASPLSVPSDNQIEIDSLRRRFGKREVLCGVDLTVRRGETLVLLGLSGSGKTTLFRHLMGSLQPQEGRILFDGRSVSEFSPDDWQTFRRQTGVVFQHAALLGSLTIEENVALPLLEVDGLRLEAVRDRVIEALDTMLLPGAEIIRLRPADLSGGMRKRVGIARAIIRDPTLLLYDEPTTGLDPVAVNGVNELIICLQKLRQVTSVVITHDLGAAFKIADRIAFLHAGRIVTCGTPEEIRHSDDAALQQLLTGSLQGPLTDRLPITS